MNIEGLQKHINATTNSHKSSDDDLFQVLDKCTFVELQGIIIDALTRLKCMDDFQALTESFFREYKDKIDSYDQGHRRYVVNLKKMRKRG